MFPSNGISLLKVLNGLSKSIAIAREFLPIYKTIKPITLQIPKVLNNLYSIRSSVSQNVNRFSEDKIAQEPIINSKGPIFFQ